MVEFSAQVQALERTRLVDDVVSRLRAMIIDGTLAPGTTLLQTELAHKLGVSRTPLREAFRILEHEGFVRVTNGNKTLEVVNLTSDDMVELYEFREVVDGLTARLCANRGVSESDIDELTVHVKQMRDIVPSNPRDAAERALVHAVFHVRLAELSGNRLVINQVPMIRLTSQMLASRLAEVVSAEPNLGATMLNAGEVDHLAVLDAIRAGVAAEAERIARRHIRRTMRSELVRR
jgi:GntR family transcriptional regulator of vanillate catabolism